jgi:hypothetical protein
MIISRVANLTSSSFAEAVESRPSIRDISSSRVRIDAGDLLAMRCSFAGLPSPELNHIAKDAPRQIPSNFKTALLDRQRPGGLHHDPQLMVTQCDRHRFD